MNSDGKVLFRRTNCRTRLIRFDPVAALSAALAHEYWEKAYLLEVKLHFDCSTSGARTRMSVPAAPQALAEPLRALESHYCDITNTKEN